MTKILNPKLEATGLLRQLGWEKPGDLSLEEIAFSIGCIVKTVDMEGSEGRIIMNSGSGIISVNSSITLKTKLNFVLAHEIAHFVMHKGLMPMFSDNEKTLSDWHKNGPHELQANEFAAELLMPTEQFNSKVSAKRLNINLIEEVAQYFHTSMTATFLKYKDVGSYPVMIIYLESGVVKWKQCSNDFPFQYLPINSKVPAWTVAGDYFGGKGIEDKPVKVAAIEWFPEDFEIKYKAAWQLWEQCFTVSQNGLISCLWTY